MQEIVLLFRKAAPRRFSIEGVFYPITKLNRIDRIQLPCDLNSILGLLRLIRFAVSLKGENIHITGHVHFMVIFLFWKNVILTIHDCNHYENLEGIRKCFVGLIWFELPCRFAKKITVISPFSKEQLIRNFGVNPNKIVVIPNSFDPIPHLGEYKTNDALFRILTIGTTFNKNLERLFDSVNGLERIHLVIVGILSPDLINALKDKKISYENFEFLEREELEIIFNSCNLLFFASTKEGFGLPILEAQSCGLPVLTSNTTSMPYVAGKGACLVDPHSVIAIRNAILRIRDDSIYRDQIVQEGYINTTRFTKDKFVKEYSQLYDQIFNCQ